MRKALICLITINILLLFNGGFSAPSKYDGMLIRKIDFTGINNVSAKDLLIELEKTEIDLGYPLRASEISKAIKLIFTKGQFEDVSLEVEEYKDGVSLRFVCRERPVISRIKFKGLKEKTEIDLQGIISIKEGDVFKANVVENSLKVIKDKYKEDGLFSAIVSYNTKKNENNNTVELIYVIDEGEKVKIEKISILGAKKIEAKKLLKAMESSAHSFMSEGKFKKDLYEQDKGKIIAYYKQNGYLDAQIIEDKVDYDWVNPKEKKDRGIYITIKVTEGEKYYFNKYSIAGNKVFDTPTLFSKFEQTKEGAVFNDTFFQMDRQSIAMTYASKGYIFARITPDRKIDEREVIEDGKPVKRKFVSIDFQIEEGSQAYIENIIIKGNKVTKDKIIRREIQVKEGELFNSTKVQISREKIFNLGFFKEVNIDVRQGSREGYMNLIIDVEEQSSGSISLGGGYGTSSGFSIYGEIAERNLMGNGQRISLKIQYGPTASSVAVSFAEPWLFNYPIGFSSSIFYDLYTTKGTSIFSNTDESSQYQQQRIGYTLGLSYKFWYYYGIGNTWKHAFTQLISASGNTSDDIMIMKSYGLDESRTLTYYIYRDTKDNYMNPTRGSRIEFSAAFTGGTILGGDDHYITYAPEFTYYYTPFHLPYLKTHPVVLELRGNGTFIAPPFNRKSLEKSHPQEDNPWLKKTDMLYLGGPETMRGWDAYDNSFPDSWQNRLYDRITYGAEIRIPVEPSMLWVVFFFDSGSLWTDSYWEKTRTESELETIQSDKNKGSLYDIRDFWEVDKMSYFKYSYGFGFKIQLPMMPLRFWFGKKLEWIGQDNGYFEQKPGFNFQFTIGDFRY